MDKSSHMLRIEHELSTVIDAVDRYWEQIQKGAQDQASERTLRYMVRAFSNILTIKPMPRWWQIRIRTQRNRSMADDVITVWISKYALTTGVFQIQATICHFINENMIAQRGGPSNACYHKPHWHLTLEEALVQAEKMRVKKEISLARALQKIQRLKGHIKIDTRSV